MSELERLKGGASAFFRWWMSQLAACLPDHLRRMARMEKAPWIIELNGTEMGIFHPAEQEDTQGDTKSIGYRVDLSREADRPSEPLRRLRDRDAEASRLVLRLPAKRVLRKVIKLPLATEENLREVLGFELDQHTPFRPEQVYSDFQILERDPKAQELSVHWVVAPRAYVNEQLDRLGAAGLFPDAIEPEGEAPASTINLLPLEQRRRGKPLLQRVNAILGGLFVLLLTAVVATPVIKKQGALTDRQAQVDVAKKEAEKASALRKEIERLTVAARFLEDKKSSSPSAVNVLNELTKLLPNDTWLYQLELNGTEVVIHGETSASSTIIGLIEASPLFEKVAFRSPVTQNRSTGGERFNLSAQVVVEKKS